MKSLKSFVRSYGSSISDKYPKGISEMWIAAGMAVGLLAFTLALFYKLDVFIVALAALASAWGLNLGMAYEGRNGKGSLARVLGFDMMHRWGSMTVCAALLFSGLTYLGGALGVMAAGLVSVVAIPPMTSFIMAMSLLVVGFSTVMYGLTLYYSVTHKSDSVS